MQSEIIELKRESVRMAMAKALFGDLKSVPSHFAIRNKTIESQAGQLFVDRMACEQFIAWGRRAPDRIGDREVLFNGDTIQVRIYYR